MAMPLYENARSAAPDFRPQDANAGLWFSRFFNVYDDRFDVEKDKAKWLKSFVHFTVGDAEQLSRSFKATTKLAELQGGGSTVLETDAPLATGLGLSHPVENGFTFHPTYGVPFLCGAAVKGMLRAWAELWMEFPSEEERQATVSRWFGTAAGDSDEEPSTGNLVFFDALPTKPLRLDCDVLTPHMGGWYESGDQLRSPGDMAAKLPADWHSPVPSPFLAVTKGASFVFAVSPRVPTDISRADAKAALKELKTALDWIGIGAKTGTGYGRLIDRVGAAGAQQT